MNIFNKIALTKPNRSVFDMSYDHKLSFKMGKLIPIHVQEALPGDKISMHSEAMFRMMPMISPIMHKVDIYVHHFFVPNRIIWDGWEKFITGGQNGEVLPAFPVLDNAELGNVEASSLADYLGVPLGDYSVGTTPPRISALPFMAYQRIWADYYRDQNLQDIGNDAIKCVDGVQPTLVMDLIKQLRDRAWEHDYFTSALPFAQKGDAVELPMDIVGDVPVKANSGAGFGQVVRGQFSGLALPNEDLGSDGTGQLSVDAGATPVYIDPEDSMYVDGEDLSSTTTINDLRTAWSLQKWLEKNARAGSRYFESLLAHFGMRSPDKRLQRPEYLGGSKASMAISEVLQTSATETETPQGNMAGHGISVTTGKDFSYYCQEHGYVISILSVRPKTAYQQGLPRHFSKFDRLDYFWPNFAFLGEQEVKNQEIFVSMDEVIDQTVFGYTPRYQEYRFNSSRVSGAMKTTLDFWHMGRKFDTLPTLNAEFIICNPTKRIFAVEADDQDEIVAHVYHKIMASRPIPKYGTPGGM